MDYAYALGCLRGVISIAEELGDSSIPIEVLKSILASFAIKGVPAEPQLKDSKLQLVDYFRTSPELLVVHGHKPYKDGLTYQEAWDRAEHKNAKYAIRKAMLAL